ncbi:hypothetical protein V3N99_05935 [Dermatophilaceae bacterium Soc4.6]
MTPTRRRRTALPVLLTALVLSTALTACTSGGSTTTPATTAVTTSRATPGAPAPTAGAGITQAPGSSLPVGAKFDWSRFDLSKPFLTGLGPSTPTFYEMVWCDVEPTRGARDWSTLDAVVTQAASIKADFMLKIRVGACWATGDTKATKVRGRKTESLMPTDLTQYRQFVTDTVARYAPRGVHEYAVENEINSPSFWGGSVDDFAKLMGVASSAIRAADPLARVVDMGVSSTAYGVGIAQRLLDQGKDAEAVSAWNTYYERRIGTRGDKIPQVADAAQLRDALGLPQNARNAQYLALAATLATTKVVDVRQVHFYESYASATLFTDYLRATTAPGVAIEAWEVGQFVRSQQLNDQERTDQLVKTVALLLGGGVSKVLWLPLVVNPNGRNGGDEPRYGLIEPDGSVRATGTVFAAMAKAAAGATISGISTPRASGVMFTRATGTSAFVWATAATITVSPSAGKLLAPAASNGGAAAPPASGGQLDSTSPREIQATGSPTDLIKALS